MLVKIMLNDKGTPAGKLADAEIQFTEGNLAGMTLLGFGVWQRRGGPGLNVTFPARQYTLNGERRSYALLRTRGEPGAQDRVRDMILQAYSETEAAAAVSR